MFEKFGRQGFVVLAINIEPEENADVVPMFDRMRLGLVPLRVPDGGWAETAFHVSAVPVDDLLDPQGKMVLRVDLSNAHGRRVLDHAITDLLARHSGSSATAVP